MSTTQLPLLSQSPSQPQSHQFKTSRRQSLLSNYDPSAYPPDLPFARSHGLAQRIGQYIPPKQDIQRCPCCLQSIYKPKLPLNCQLKQLLHIGCAYPLYLLFVKQCILLICINILIIGIPSFVVNLTQGNMCQQFDGLVYSFYGFICKSSVLNIMNVNQIDMLELQSALNFGAIFVSAVLIGFMEVHMNVTYRRYYNDYNILPRASDYSVLVKGLPKDITISEIQQFLSDKMLQKQCTDTLILKIYLLYNLKTYYSLYANKRSMIEQIVVMQKKRGQTRTSINMLDGSQPPSERARLLTQQRDLSEMISESQNKKQMIQIQINNYEELFKTVIRRITNQEPIDPSAAIKISQKQKEKQEKGENRLQFSGKCIVTLNSIESKQALTEQARNFFILQKLGYQLGECLGGTSSPIVIVDAPEPSQIIFSNIGSPKIKRWRDSICVTLALFLLIFLDFVLLTLQKKFVKQQKAINSSNLMLSFINSQIIALFNSIVSRVIRTTQNKTQMHSTQSSYYYSVTFKLVVLYMINMLVTTFFSNLVNYYLFNQKSKRQGTFPLNFQQYLFDIFFLLITNPFVSFFLIFFDHRQGYKYYKRYQLQKQLIAVTQAEANLYYEDMQIDLSNKYSNIYRFVLFSAGVCFIFPPSLFICAFTLCVFYWEDKILLLRRYTIAHKLNFTLTAKLQKIMWFFPLMMAATNLVIMFVPIQNGKAFQQGKYSKAYYYIAIIMMVSMAILWGGGCTWLTSFIFKTFYSKESDRIRKQPEYKDIEMDFESDYWHYYPYFKVKKMGEGGNQNTSPRKDKIDEMNRKMGMDVFSVMKNHLHHDRYAPIV